MKRKRIKKEPKKVIVIINPFKKAEVKTNESKSKKHTI